MAPILTHADLLRVLSYSPTSGEFVWLIAASNNPPGSRAGGLTRGYRTIGIAGWRYRANRLVWFWMTGRWPEHNVDHRNGVKDDDRWDNLRDVTQRLNLQNQRAPGAANTSGFLGVSWSKKLGCWRANITTPEKQILLGRFPTAESASSAYLEAKRRLHAGCTI